MPRTTVATETAPGGIGPGGLAPGGMAPGGLPANATDCFQEGLVLPPIQLERAGEPDQDLLSLIAANSPLAHYYHDLLEFKFGPTMPRPRR
mgnify:CR=1 FL=1